MIKNKIDPPDTNTALMYHLPSCDPQNDARRRHDKSTAAAPPPHPIPREQAKAFLRSYSGGSVRTLSALCVTNLEDGRKAEGVHEAEVFWREIQPDVIDAVVERGVVMGSVSERTFCEYNTSSIRHRYL